MSLSLGEDLDEFVGQLGRDRFEEVRRVHRFDGLCQPDQEMSIRIAFSGSEKGAAQNGHRRP
jgi:hypothetical protein